MEIDVIRNSRDAAHSADVLQDWDHAGMDVDS